MAIIPINPIPVNSGLYSNIQPFTVRDNATFIIILEEMRQYINNKLIPFINTNVSQLEASWIDQANALIEAWNVQSDELIAQVQGIADSLGTSVADALAAKEAAEAAAALAEQFASDIVTLQDSAILAILSDTDSDSRGFLDDTYALKSEIITLTTALGNVGTIVESLQTSVDTDIPESIAQLLAEFDNYVSSATLDEVTAENVLNVDSETRSAIEGLIINHTETFTFDTAEANYGIRVGGATTTRVMQSIGVSDKPSGYIMTSYVQPGTTGARESTLVVLHSAAGKAMGEMLFTDAGHGTGVIMETSDEGQVFIWLSFTNHSVTSGVGRYNYVRVPWSAGTTHTWATAQAYKVNALSRDTYLTAHYDERNGIIGVRTDNGSGTGATFTVHTVPNLLSGTWNPMFTMTYNYPAGLFVQGWAYLDGYWYIYSGSSETESTYAPAEILQVDAQTGQLRLRRSFEQIRNSWTGAPLLGSSEPEGMGIARGYGGDPSIIVGVSSGLVGGRSHTLWWIGAGFTPFRFAGQAYDQYVGGTDWTAYPLIADSEFTPITSPGSSFGARRSGEYLELRGQIEGPFGTGQTRIGDMRPGFYHPSRLCRFPITKSSVAASPATTARCELNSAGQLSVWIAPGATGNAGWVDFTGFRVPIFG